MVGPERKYDNREQVLRAASFVCIDGPIRQFFCQATQDTGRKKKMYFFFEALTLLSVGAITAPLENLSI
jgi:hypothetical protein